MLHSGSRSSVLFTGWPETKVALAVFHLATLAERLYLYCACSPLPFHPTSDRHHDRALALVFGSDGQVSLIGFDGGIASQVLHTLTAGNTGAIASLTYSVPNESASVSPPPNLDATSAPFTDDSSVASSTPTSTYDSSTPTTGTDTDNPSIPTIYYPTPDPSPVANPKDHGIGAPFYLAMVLASISCIGCLGGFIAWWIRSRTRGRPLELSDPWVHEDHVPNPPPNNAHRLDDEEYLLNRRFFLTPSVAYRDSPEWLTIAGPITEDGIVRDALRRHPSLYRANDTRLQALNPKTTAYRNAPFSQATNPYPRPGTARLPTGLSVQESTRTLGELRVANRVPGDVTSGDEGGMNNGSRVQESAGSSSAPNGNGVSGAAPVLGYTMQNARSDQGVRSFAEGDAVLEPPGPATFSWGKRTDTVAALRRTRRRAPDATVQTHKNARYGGYWYPAMDEAPSGTTWQARHREDNEKASENPSLDPLGWKSTLRSSFWQAVDAMTGTRSLDPVANAGGGSGFTPAPQRVVSRRSPVSSTRPSTGTSFADSSTVRSQETQSKYALTLSNESAATQTIPRISISGSPTRGSELNASSIGEVTLRSSLPPTVSHLDRDLGASAHPDSLRTDTGSLYSTDTGVARANWRKYGRGDSIPSSWSALGANRDSQLDVDRMYLPLPRSIRSPSPGLLSTMPSQLTLVSGLVSSSASTHTRTRASVYSESLIGSDASILRPRKNAHAANGGGTAASSTFGVSRQGTVQSGHSTLSTIGHGTGPSSHSLSAASSMLSRKKGVTTRRKRPRLPPRALSSASSVQSVESGRSTREVAVRRALLERRKKVKAAESLKSRGDESEGSREASVNT